MAETNSLPAITEARQRLRQYLTSQAMANLPRYMVGGLAAGAAARGLVGLGGLLRRNLGGASRPSARYIAVPVASPAEPDARRDKQAAAIDVHKATRQAQGMAGGFKDFLGGGSARTIEGIPWYMPARTVLTLGGAAAGWHGLDYLLDKQRLAKQRRDVEDARRDFQDAIADAATDKRASELSPQARQLRQALDELYQVVRVKMADASGPLPALTGPNPPAAPTGSLPTGEYLGRAAGMYGTYGVLAAALAARVAYKANKRRSRREALRKAQTARQRGMAQTSPPPIVALSE